MLPYRATLPTTEVQLAAGAATNSTINRPGRSTANILSLLIVTSATTRGAKKFTIADKGRLLRNRDVLLRQNKKASAPSSYSFGNGRDARPLAVEQF